MSYRLLYNPDENPHWNIEPLEGCDETFIQPGWHVIARGFPDDRAAKEFCHHIDSQQIFEGQVIPSSELRERFWEFYSGFQAALSMFGEHASFRPNSWDYAINDN